MLLTNIGKKQFIEDYVTKVEKDACMGLYLWIFKQRHLNSKDSRLKVYLIFIFGLEILLWLK
jgi:hypothetical protein